MLGRILIGLVRAYQVGISSWMPPTCRFTPSCSEYAVVAIGSHGALRGAWLTVRRLARCHPWGGFGFDPVPSVPGDGAASRAEESGKTAGSSGGEVHAG